MKYFLRISSTILFHCPVSEDKKGKVVKLFVFQGRFSYENKMLEKVEESF